MIRTTTEQCQITWLSCTAISVLTTKHIFENGGHFPMHLAAMHLAAVLALRIARWCLSRIFPLHSLQSTTEVLATNRFSTPRQSLHAMYVSAALLLGYQAVLHVSNLPVVMLLLNLDLQCLVHWNHLDKKRTIALFSCMMQLCGLSMILIFDFRSSPIGIILLTTAAGSATLARLVRPAFSADIIGKPYCVRATRPFLLRKLPADHMDLLSSLLLALFWCYFREWQYPFAQIHDALALNGITSIVNLVSSGFSLHKSLPPSRDSFFRVRNYDSRGSHDLFNGLTVSTTLVCGVAAAGCLQASSPPTISTLQWLGFCIASYAAPIIEAWKGGRIRAVCAYFPESSWAQMLTNLRQTTARTSANRQEVGTRFDWLSVLNGCTQVFIPMTILVSCTILLFSALKTSSTPMPKSPELDKSFNHTRALDIVIARYDEPASAVAKHLAELLALPSLEILHPAVVVYDKHENYENRHNFANDLYGIHKAISASSRTNLTVQSMSNIGRETDTYLHHITTRWSDLANHTIFMQAGVHFGPKAYVSRIRDYFVPSTGFLSLAPSDYFCTSCDDCYDRAWSEDPRLLRRIYKDFNQGTECEDIVLTYRGQFVVSAARIRGNKISVYSRWLDELRQPQSRLHTTPYTDNPWNTKKDSLSAPRAGFTFERLWGTIFQCNDRRIADRCPSLLNGIICPASLCGVSKLEYCQCLDY